MVKKMVQTEHGEKSHIDIEKVDDSLDDKNKFALESVKMSALNESCTKFIKAVEFVDEDDEIIILCDCPGTGDSRGVELEVANIFGIVIAVEKTKSIVPVIVLSQEGMGDRMKGLKDITKELSHFF